MPKLRGHHLICLHFFHGDGYDPGFADNLRTVMAKVREEKIELCAGPDDICGECPYLRGDRCTYNETADEEIAEMDSDAFRLLGMTPGTSADWDRIRESLAPLFPEWYESYCRVCDWRRACEKDEFFGKLVRG